jgi:hypothetical protein
VAEKKTGDKGTKGIKITRKEIIFPDTCDMASVNEYVVLMVIT